APSLAVAAIAAKACLPRPRHIGRTASGATFQVCRSLSGPVDREARSFASVIGAPRSMPRADSGAPRPQFTNSRPGERHLALGWCNDRLACPQLERRLVSFTESALRGTTSDSA